MSVKTVDVIIVGGGPAGLSAAITLARACRTVLLFDDGHPRNEAAKGVHCFLGSEGVPPSEIRRRGRETAAGYGVELVDEEVIEIACLDQKFGNRFQARTKCASFQTLAVLLATGVRDILPDIPGIDQFYGTAVHHCPYCDGWEHRGKHLIAVGQKAAALGITLSTWSKQVTVCSNGEAIDPDQRLKLQECKVGLREEHITGLRGEDGILTEILLGGDSLACDAIFFSGEQEQRSKLPSLIGCECDEKGHAKTSDGQCTNVEGVYIAGDADGEVQFAIAAAAEGAAAAVAIDKWLRTQSVS